MKNKIEFIIFDLDNTLYDFDTCWNYAHKQLFSEIQAELKIDSIDYSKFIAEYLKQNDILWHKNHNNSITLQELRVLRPLYTFNHLGISVSEHFCEQFYDRMFEKLINHTKPNPIINELLKKLSKQCSIYILTNGLVNEQQIKIDKIEIKPYITKTYISENIGFEKPDKNVFSFVLKDINKNASAGIMIGDSYRNDISGALSCGMNATHSNYKSLSSKQFKISDILYKKS